MLKEFKTILKFGSIGIIGTLINFLVFNILYYIFLIKEGAEIISYILALFFVIYANKSYTFNNTSFGVPIIKFYIIYLVIIAVPVFIIYLIVYESLLDILSPNLALFFAIAVNFIVSYILSKLLYNQL